MTQREGIEPMSEKPEQVTPGVYRVDGLPRQHLLAMFLIEGEDGWTLVDAGLPGSLGRIRDGLAALGGGPNEIRRVVVTHHHVDHVGGLGEVHAWAPGAEVLASPHEAAIISGQRRADPMRNRLARALNARYTAPSVPVDRVLRAGDVVAGFRVVPTSGHTAGHIALLRDADGVLLTGDAFGRLLAGRIRVGVAAPLSANPAEARRSGVRLLREEFDTALFSHGVPVLGGAHAALREAVGRSRA